MALNLIYHLKQAVGLELPILLPFIYMCIRALIVFFLGTIIARFNKKLFGIHTPFNIILLIMLGSIFVNAITSEKNFLPTIGAVLCLILINGLVTAVVFYSKKIEFFIKGEPAVLIKNGQIQTAAMKQNFITDRELYHEMYLQLHIDDIRNISSATLESDGSINFIVKKI